MAKLPASRKRKHPKKAEQTARRKLRETYRKLEAYDGCLRPEGGLLVGIDEVGRGALAGPVVAAAVVLPPDSGLLGVNDSKKLSEDEREAVFPTIVEKALALGIAHAPAALIDRDNVLNASLMAMAQALQNLRVRPDLVLLDGRDRIDVPGRVVPVIGGDAKSLSIAAASVLAKVARDRMMRKLHKVHPVYNFLSNKGYGTKEHMEAISKHGMTSTHRRRYCLSAVENTPTLF